MAGSRTIILLTVIMAVLCTASVGITIILLYQNQLDQTRTRLRVSAESQARLIEAMARFDRQWSTNYPEGSEAATLAQISDSQEHFNGFGRTGEFTLARREADQILFLMSHRRAVTAVPGPVQFDSQLAEPMRRALSGLSGSVIGLDYGGNWVLAGYEPVAELGLGIVAKIDLDEIREPFIAASLIAGGLTAVLILVGVFLFQRASIPLLERQRELELQLRQRQKLESIGTLAGGVAHEINNPIFGIMNYAQLISERLDPASPLREFADGIGLETKRVAKIVRNLLSFARQDPESHCWANIADVVDDTVSLIKTVVSHDQILLEVDVPENLPRIKCRNQQIQQVLMNLLTNARDALNERYPGHDPDKIMTVTVRPFAKDGQSWLRTTVEDHGSGITNEVRERLFDPFFTTKDRAKGTGLGLSISHGIVMDHQGELYVEPLPSKHTRFYLDLPVDNGWVSGTD